MAAVEGGWVRDYSGGLTVPVAIVCIIAASCGLIFGYDLGVTGNYIAAAWQSAHAFLMSYGIIDV